MGRAERGGWRQYARDWRLAQASASGEVLFGLALNALFGWWWADSLAALALLVWLIPEARETLESARAGRGGCGCGDE